MPSTNFFEMDVKSKAGESLVKAGVDYKLIKDGNGIEYKIVNFENPKYCLREGIIELIPMRVTTRHENKVGFRITTDKVTDIIYGIPNGINSETKKLEFKKINLTDSETLDLTNVEDAMRWTCIKNSFFCENSPNLRGKPIYKVRDKEKVANQYLNDRVWKRKAVDIAEGLSGNQLMDMARNLGIPPENNSMAVMQMEVIKRAEDDAKAFMTIWDSPTRKELTILKRALACGIVTQEINTGFCYRGNPLGTNAGNESMVIEYLREQPQIANTIDLLCKQVENDSETSMNKSDVNVVTDDKDARMVKLEAELAEKNKLLNDLTTKNIISEATEHQIWLKEAKRLTIKGCHLIKSLDLLKEKVLEANPEFIA